jgi:hypothetical protein
MWRLAGAAHAPPGPVHEAPWLDPPADACAVRGPEDFLFAWLVNLGALLTKSSGKTRQKLTTFRELYLPQHPSPQLLFSVYRLLVPKVCAPTLGRLCPRRPAGWPQKKGCLCALRADRVPTRVCVRDAS